MGAGTDVGGGTSLNMVLLAEASTQVKLSWDGMLADKRMRHYQKRRKKRRGRGRRSRSPKKRVVGAPSATGGTPTPRKSALAPQLMALRERAAALKAEEARRGRQQLFEERLLLAVGAASEFNDLAARFGEGLVSCEVILVNRLTNSGGSGDSGDSGGTGGTGSSAVGAGGGDEGEAIGIESFSVADFVQADTMEAWIQLYRATPVLNNGTNAADNATPDGGGDENEGGGPLR